MAGERGSIAADDGGLHLSQSPGGSGVDREGSQARRVNGPYLRDARTPPASDRPAFARTWFDTLAGKTRPAREPRH